MGINKYLKPFNIKVTKIYKTGIRNWDDEYFPRPAINYLQQYGNLNQPAVIAEIGVHRGLSAEGALKSIPIKKFYLIDPWSDVLYPLMDETITRLKKWESVCEYIRKTSDDAVNDIPDNSLDLCYIDGDHSKEQVEKDIKNYFPKVKVGGIIAGHNINHAFRISQHRGVFEAVNDFCIKNKLTLLIESPDWIIKKERN